jgi:hypothetical protein
MNVRQITGEEGHTSLWVYFVIASSLMAATFGGWYVWARSLSRLEKRARAKALLSSA